MNGALIRLILSIGCMIGVLTTHKAATLFSESAAIMERTAINYCATASDRRKLKIRANMWRTLYLLMVCLMVAFTVMATVTFILFTKTLILEVFR